MNDHNQEVQESEPQQMLGADIEMEDDEHAAFMRQQLREEQARVKQQLLHRHLWYRPIPVAYNHTTAFLLTMHQYALVYKNNPGLKALGEGNFYAALNDGRIRYTGKVADLQRNEHNQITTTEGWVSLVPPMIPLYNRAFIEYPPKTDNKLKLWGTDLKFEPAQYTPQNKIQNPTTSLSFGEGSQIEGGFDLIEDAQSIAAAEAAMDSDEAGLRALTERDIEQADRSLQNTQDLEDLVQDAKIGA